MEIKLNSCWKCTNGTTGAGIVLKIENVHESFIETYGCDKVYHFITDFGNIVVLTEQELLSGYEFSHVEDDIILRFERQQMLLRQVCTDYL